jgi:hypothetical protein
MLCGVANSSATALTHSEQRKAIKPSSVGHRLHVFKHGIVRDPIDFPVRKTIAALVEANQSILPGELG